MANLEKDLAKIRKAREDWVVRLRGLDAAEAVILNQITSATEADIVAEYSQLETVSVSEITRIIGDYT